MNRIYFSPWICVEPFHIFKRVALNNPINYFGYANGYYGSFTCSACIDGKSVYYKNNFTSMLNATNHMNKWLVDNGCVLLSQEQWDKLALLA